MSIMLALILIAAVNQQSLVPQRVPIEVLQINELPITITETELVRTKDGYLLKCVVSNNSEFLTLGLKYSLTVVDTMNRVKTVFTTDEGLKLRQSQTKKVTFKTPIKLKMKPDERLVLMLEQVVSTDYIWEVVKAKENLEAYLAGNYSVVPRVLCLRNQVDTPPRRSVIY
jgi:hypothetical protein